MPFDFSRSALAIDVTVHGTPLHVLLDTGVDPSVVDAGRVQALGLAADRSDSGEASGFGDGKGAQVFPAPIEGLAIGDRHFARFDAVATDMAAISAGYGRKLDAVLGYSFLADKIVLIDYPASKLAILGAASQSAMWTRGCAKRWQIPLKTYDSFPLIPAFRFGRATGPVTIDTGYNGNIALFGSAVALPGVRGALAETGSVSHVGARGEAKTSAYALRLPVGFGPFTLPPGEAVMLHKAAESPTTRVANIGNKLFAAMKLKLLLDYPGRRMAFYGECR